MSLPKAVGRTVARPIRAFIETEVSSGFVLLVATAIALIWANASGEAYAGVFGHSLNFDAGALTIEEDVRGWINDGLITVFFFVAGLEIKREVLRGELAGRQRAMLPMFAAVGGMVLPALIYTALNGGGSGERGWGIPMATDITFALGVLALAGRGIPSSVRVFLLAMAIVDDIGSIAVIAIFYSGGINFAWLFGAVALLAGIVLLQRLGVRWFAGYAVGALALWVATLESGISTTIAAVALGLLTPMGVERFVGEELVVVEEGPLERLEALTHPVAVFVAAPIFALANAGIALDGFGDTAGSSITIGIVLARVLGKPAGILLTTWIAVRLGFGQLPRAMEWLHVLAVGLIGGVGFTVALLINDLALNDPRLAEEGKLGILGASLISGGLGWAVIVLFGRRSSEPEDATDR